MNYLGHEWIQCKLNYNVLLKRDDVPIPVEQIDITIYNFASMLKVTDFVLVLDIIECFQDA